LLVVLSTAALQSGLAGVVYGQYSQTTATWKYDEIGYAYREALFEGRWQRLYRQPLRQAVAWEVARNLPTIGLPAPCDGRSASGVDACGRSWRRDALGYAYYETCCCGTNRTYYQPERQSVAALVNRQLACVDWGASVRGGVANAMVRGLNAASVPSLDDRAVRSVVRERIVDGLNRAAAGAGSGSLTRFQQLVAEGVEDAMVEAFNQIDLVADAQQQAPPRDRHEAMSEDISVLRVVRRGEHARPRAVGDPGAVPVNGQDGGPVVTHYGGPLQRAAFSQRYAKVRFVDSGWIIGPFGTRPVTGDGLLILSLRGDHDAVEVWQDGLLISTDCRYVEYFEDAQRMAALPEQD
jgi:hypothetical protein